MRTPLPRRSVTAALLFAAGALSSIACRSIGSGTLTPALLRAGGDTILRGDPSGFQLVGLRPGARVELVTRRAAILTRREGDQTIADTVGFESRAVFVADRRGAVDVDRAAPVDGDWRSPDPLAPFWAMHRTGTPTSDELQTLLRPPSLDVRVRQDGREVAQRRFAFPAEASLQARVVLGPGFAGAYAVPSVAGPHPVLLALHGSEGGDTTEALGLARRFAARGFATFAVTYVAYAWNGGLPGVPAAFDSIPVETLDRVRRWVGAQADADTARTGLWGVSKGAEFALVTAARRPWVRAVVSCVGSDVMWAGFGRTPPADGVLTSWADAGGRLPAIPYDRYDDVFEGKATARAVHDRSRAKAPQAAIAARIPIERSRAPLLLIGGDADETWASAEMSRSIARTMRERAPDVPVDTLLYAQGSHGLCGVGTTPAAGFGDERDPVARGTAAGAAGAWRATLAFLARHLAR